jgi:non-homologous end joining protein Ku
MKMAIQLIEQLSGPFDIDKYKDTYSDELMKLIKAKAKGVKQTTSDTPRSPPERKGRPAVTAESQPSGLQTPRILDRVALLLG